MLFRVGGGGAAGAAAAAGMKLVRYFSRKCAPDLKRINPKVPREEAKAISQGLFQIIKERGPLSVSNTWNHAKEAGIDGLSSKTHMKIMLKWMRGRKMLKLFCTHHGSAKRFLHSTLPEDPRPVEQEIVTAAPSDSLQPSMRQEKKQLKKLNKKQKRFNVA
ncbi:uncharacterized protein A4U43_C04F10900 [Asparagus officinalis]|uniref:Uncharacterized protein n=1 Tax=Asparagus officinalis TaxID=4686 RepID=A0A5P1F4E1_ASPOF|nr:uncharacterized protein LOC109837063 [Asparagus officinalis]ONK71649.1 uncharacterized protein A4U43_C04F10900 [Asparagus officinalis]